jgi:hypothetical protein
MKVHQKFANSFRKSGDINLEIASAKSCRFAECFAKARGYFLKFSNPNNLFIIQVINAFASLTRECE